MRLTKTALNKQVLQVQIDLVCDTPEEFDALAKQLDIMAKQQRDERAVVASKWAIGQNVRVRNANGDSLEAVVLDSAWDKGSGAFYYELAVRGSMNNWYAVPEKAIEPRPLHKYGIGQLVRLFTSQYKSVPGVVEGHLSNSGKESKYLVKIEDTGSTVTRCESEIWER